MKTYLKQRYLSKNPIYSVCASNAKVSICIFSCTLSSCQQQQSDNKQSQYSHVSGHIILPNTSGSVADRSHLYCTTGCQRGGAGGWLGLVNATVNSIAVIPSSIPRHVILYKLLDSVYNSSPQQNVLDVSLIKSSDSTCQCVKQGDIENFLECEACGLELKNCGLFCDFLFVPIYPCICKGNFILFLTKNHCHHLFWANGISRGY